MPVNDMTEEDDNPIFCCTFCHQESYPLTQRDYLLDHQDEGRIELELFLCRQCEMKSREQPYQFHQQLKKIFSDSPS